MTNAPAMRSHHAASELRRSGTRAKGKAISPPRMKPLLLKSRVGSQGSRMGNKTTVSADHKRPLAMPFSVVAHSLSRITLAV